MIVDVSVLGSDIVISGVFAFLAGMVSLMVYTRVRKMFVDRRYRVDEAIVEAVVLEYSRRLRDYDKILADINSKIDIMEIKAQSAQIPTTQYQQISHQPQPHVTPMSEPIEITQRHSMIEDNNGTTDYILKLLVEKPRTSREVQLAIGRTREHTARLMKKLHDAGFVSRDSNAKPFKYEIMDSGRERLKERIAPPAV